MAIAACTMITKEEAHWSSFRSAVFAIQSTLAQQPSGAPQANKLANIGSKSPDHINDNMQRNTEDTTGSAASRHDEVIRESQSAMLDATSNKTTPQSNELDTTNMGVDNEETCDSWEDTNNNTQAQSHRQLELVGLEEVNKSANSRNNTLGNNALISPANAPSHTSHTTNALSVAEQQLAETRLKLAMTEAERDELEFQLMQNTR